MHVCVQACVHVYVYVCKLAMCVFMYACMYVCACTYVYVCVCVCACTYVCVAYIEEVYLTSLNHDVIDLPGKRRQHYWSDYYLCSATRGKEQ